MAVLQKACQEGGGGGGKKSECFWGPKGKVVERGCGDRFQVQGGVLKGQKRAFQKGWGKWEGETHSNQKKSKIPSSLQVPTSNVRRSKTLEATTRSWQPSEPVNWVRRWTRKGGGGAQYEAASIGKNNEISVTPHRNGPTIEEKKKRATGVKEGSRTKKAAETGAGMHESTISGTTPGSWEKKGEEVTGKLGPMP